MKKRAASLALVLSMILSFTCQAGAVDANSGDDGQQVSTYAALEASAQSGGLTKLNAVKYILLDCGMKETQFPSGDSDYIAMAKSVGIADDKFDGSAACSLEELHTMENSTAAVNLRNAVKNGTPLFVDGVAQPIFRTRAAFRPRTATATIRATSSATRFTLRPTTTPTAMASLIW